MPEMTLMLPTWRRWPFHYRAASRTDPVFFTIVIAAAEVVVGLAIFVALFVEADCQPDDLTSMRHEPGLGSSLPRFWRRGSSPSSPAAPAERRPLHRGHPDRFRLRSCFRRAGQRPALSPEPIQWLNGAFACGDRGHGPAQPVDAAGGHRVGSPSRSIRQHTKGDPPSLLCLMSRSPSRCWASCWPALYPDVHLLAWSACPPIS